MSKTAKALIAALALGLWANAAAIWLRPVPVQAQTVGDIVFELRNLQLAVSNLQTTLILMQTDLSSIQNDVLRIQRGTCGNGTIC